MHNNGYMDFSHPTYTLEEAIRKLEGYCAYQERCHKEVVQKLRDMRMIPDAIDQIVVHLIDHNFLNEERFSMSYARGKFNIKKWGRIRITQELKRREISKYNIKKAVAQLNTPAYLDTLDALAKKRLDSIKETNIQKRRKKLADYLLYRGWESHLVYEKITELIK